jgi:hypothetical protein
VAGLKVLGTVPMIPEDHAKPELTLTILPKTFNPVQKGK